ncbi:MAG: ribonuclease P protein subunit [Thermosphaera sp.]
MLKRRSSNLLYHELIGLKARILEYPDPSIKGFQGEVVDETLKTLVLSDGSRRIRVFKENGVFMFTLPSGENVIIKGFKLLGRPWDRVKMVLR